MYKIRHGNYCCPEFKDIFMYRVINHGYPVHLWREPVCIADIGAYKMIPMCYCPFCGSKLNEKEKEET